MRYVKQLHLQVLIALGDYMDAQCHACIGGTNVRTDIMKLELGQHVVVGTPGRVFDMISRRALGEYSHGGGNKVLSALDPGSV